MNGLFEILSNKEWMIQQEFLHSILPTLQYNITNHASLGIEREKKSPMIVNQMGSDVLKEYQVTEDGTVLPVSDWGNDVLGKMREPFVNVMPVDGPITRNGGACSYGSRDIRDWMMKAADNNFCQGHVLHINTPGGSAWAKNDFQQGIDYAHAKGQRVIGFIDGLCASAGMYLASLCDEVYVMNPKDQLGCVGVMAAFFTMKNGDKDLSTGETYREYYDPESVDKNKEMRDIAEDDDATLLIAELKKLGEEFRADMKAAFPKADVDEHLKGKIFYAEDVMGILCDGQMMLGDVISRVFDLANDTAQPIERTAVRKIAKRQQARMEAGAAKESILSQTNNSINMKEKFPALFAALQVEEMQMQEGGAFMNEGLLATLNTAIEESQKAVADAKALAEQLTAEKAELEQNLEAANSEHTAAIAVLNTEHAEAIAVQTALVEEKQNAIATLEQEKADLTDEVNGKTKSIEQLSAALDNAKASFETATKTIAEKEQVIADLNATIDEMKQDAGEGAQAGSPASNGTGAEAQVVVISSQYAYDSSKTYEENMAAKAAWEKDHGKK